MSAIHFYSYFQDRHKVMSFGRLGDVRSIEFRNNVPLSTIELINDFLVMWLPRVQDSETRGELKTTFFSDVHAEFHEGAENSGPNRGPAELRLLSEPD